MAHQERWNGSGYPNNLKGEEIPLAGRIVAICDVFDALTSKRYNKEAFSIEKSMEIINKVVEKILNHAWLRPSKRHSRK